MSHSNTTANYHLPQFIGTDTPAWLTDVNGAFEDIDSAISNTALAAQEAKVAADAAQGTADSAANVAAVLANTTVPALNARVTDLHSYHALGTTEGSISPQTVITLNDAVSNYQELAFVLGPEGTTGGVSSYSVIEYKTPQTITVTFCWITGNGNIRREVTIAFGLSNNALTVMFADTIDLNLTDGRFSINKDTITGINNISVYGLK